MASAAAKKASVSEDSEEELPVVDEAIATSLTPDVSRYPPPAASAARKF